MESRFEFIYGPMGCGKTRNIFSTRYEDISKDKYVIIIKPSKDKKGEDYIVSRDNEQIKVDLLITENDNIYNIISNYLLENNLDTILVDEVQFMNSNQIEQLKNINHIYNIKIICYGLLTDFQGNMFNGSKRLIECGAKLIELEKKCEMNMCDNRATFNARFIDNEFVLEGTQVAIDNYDATYKSLCGKCYDKLVKNYNKKVKTLQKNFHN